MNRATSRPTRIVTAASLALSSWVAAPPLAHAEQCRELGGLGVAVGALVAAGIVTATALIAPAIAAENDESLTYGQGVLVTFLTGAAGVGAGTFISASAYCEGGLWLPGAAGLATGVTGSVVWAAVASEPGEAVAAVAPSVRSTIVRFDF